MRLCHTVTVLLILGLLVFSACVPNLGFGCDSEPAATPVPTGPVHAEFYASHTTQEGHGRIYFYSMSTGHVKEWLWDLNGDGRIDTNGPEASHFYLDNGYFTVTLTVEGWDGSTDTMTKVDYIYIYGCST